MGGKKIALIQWQRSAGQKTNRPTLWSYIFWGVFLGGLGVGLLPAQEKFQDTWKTFFLDLPRSGQSTGGIAYPSEGSEPEEPLPWVSYQEGASLRPSSAAHVPELARYLDQVQIGQPVFYRQLAVYPIFLERGVRLEGQWLTLDQAMRQGVLVVTEKDGGSVPVIIVENRSRDEYVFLMTGEILSGGKQTRTVRQDVVLAPGQRVDLNVFCVERGRWHGEEKFLRSERMAPLMVQKQIVQGEGQSSVWGAIGGLAARLRASNPSENLEMALDAPHVRQDLEKVHKEIMPRIPDKTMGFLFLQGRRPMGADMFGDARIARQLLPKLLDAYAVDCILLDKDAPAAERAEADREAIEFFQRIVRAGSQRAQTPGSGAGIRTDALGLVGGGVSFGDTLVHYGVYVRSEPIIPMPHPKPMEGFRPHRPLED